MIKIDFQQNITEELRLLFRIYKKPSDFTELRSVVWNPFVIVKSLINKSNNLKYINDEWNKIDSEINQAFEVLTIEVQKPVICYIVSCGPEGMFNPDKNNIHARYDGKDTWANFVETVIHEVVHLGVYEVETYSYEKGEDDVDKVMNMEEIKKIISHL